MRNHPGGNRVRAQLPARSYDAGNSGSAGVPGRLGGLGVPWRATPVDRRHLAGSRNSIHTDSHNAYQQTAAGSRPRPVFGEGHRVTPAVGQAPCASQCGERDLLRFANLAPSNAGMIKIAVNFALLAGGIGLLPGCAPTAGLSPAPEAAKPDCSFRSATSCWTLGTRFPTGRAEPGDSLPLRIVSPPPAALASTADSTRQAQ